MTSKTLYQFTNDSGEKTHVCVCEEHQTWMPEENGYTVRAMSVAPELLCDFCEDSK